MSHSAILSKSDRFILAKLGLIFVPSVSVTQPRIVPLSNPFHPAISFFEKCPIMSVFLSCSFFLPSLFFWLWSITKWAPCPPRAFFFPSVYYGTLNSANRSRRVCDSFAIWKTETAECTAERLLVEKNLEHSSYWCSSFLPDTPLTKSLSYGLKAAVKRREFKIEIFRTQIVPMTRPSWGRKRGRER